MQEAEGLLLKLVPALQKRYVPKHPLVPRATRDLVFLLEKAGKDAEEWRFHSLGTEEDADSTAIISAEQVLDHSLPGEDEDWDGSQEVTDLLRDLLLKPPKPSYRGSEEIQKVAGSHSSDPSSSEAKLSHRQSGAPGASASDSASQPSHAVVWKPGSSSRSFESSDATISDSLAALKAAAKPTWKKRAEREK